MNCRIPDEVLSENDGVVTPINNDCFFCNNDGCEHNPYYQEKGEINV